MHAWVNYYKFTWVQVVEVSPFLEAVYNELDPYSFKDLVSKVLIAISTTSLIGIWKKDSECLGFH